MKRAKAKIRIKPVPKRPTRKVVKTTFCLHEGSSLINVVEHFTDLGFDLNNVIYEATNDYDPYYDDDPEYIFTAKGPESDESFQARISQYEHKFRAYQFWYEENETLIREELEYRRIFAEEKKIIDAEKAKKAMKKARIKAAKELAKLDEKIIKMQDL